MSRFKEITGDDLRMEGKVLDLRRIGGVRSVSLSVAKSLRKKYGEFRYVVVWGNTTTLEGQLLDPSQRQGKPAADRVYWSKGYNELSADPRPYWSAEKYRGNVKLIWFPPSRKKGLDGRLPEARIGAYEPARPKLSRSGRRSRGTELVREGSPARASSRPIAATESHNRY